MEKTGKNYLYVFTDPTKKGLFKYGKFKFEFQPFYIGISNTETYYKLEDLHIKYAKIKKDITNNKYKMNIINKILKSNKEPVIYYFYKNSNREFIFNKEKEMIATIGTRYKSTGPLVNISLGGEGGDNFTNHPRKEEIREKHRLNALGVKNSMYGLPLEERPSHIAKLNGNHWNSGRLVSEDTRKILRKINGGSNNNRAKETLLFDKNFILIKKFDYCSSVSEYIGCSKKMPSRTASKNSKKNIPYHTTKGYIIIYKDDWDNKFKNKENEIKEFLKTFKKNKNQYS